MLEDRMFPLIMRRCSFVNGRNEDIDQIRRKILPAVEKPVKRFIPAWEREADALMRPFLETKPELYWNIKSLAQALTFKQVLEHLKCEFLGRNSFVEQEPHPHSGCASSIVETGRVQAYPSELQEGMDIDQGPD